MLISRGTVDRFLCCRAKLVSARSKSAFIALSLSVIAIIVAELGPPTALVSTWTGPFKPDSIVVAWDGGLRLLSESFLLGGLWLGMRDIQAVSVRYVYRG